MEDRMRILLVEDDRAVRITVRDALEDAGYPVVAAEDGNVALSAMRQDPFDLLLTDVRLPGVDGITLFRRIRELQPSCATILMTAYGLVEDAVTVIQEGADDYITKPFDVDVLLLRIDRLRDKLLFRQALEEGGCDPETFGPDSGTRRIVGISPAVHQVLERIEAAAKAGVNVLISGETGTGKELCARTLHCKSSRSHKPFVHVNCAAIPSELLEAEMFGHERGAFTGAVRRRKGRLLAANGGTLFLDEVGELNPEHQAKLLNAIESGTFEPVGSSEQVQVDVWILSATNRDLKRDVEEGTFRQDLFYRLNIIEIVVPSLRERRNDIPLLVSDFLREFSVKQGAPMPDLSPSAMAALFAYDYPGNIRELFHALEHGLALSGGKEIDTKHLPPTFQATALPDDVSTEGYIPLTDAVRQFERSYIKRVLDQVGGKRGEAAKVLGISRKSLWLKLKDDYR